MLNQLITTTILIPMMIKCDQLDLEKSFYKSLRNISILSQKNHSCLLLYSDFRKLTAKNVDIRGLIAGNLIGEGLIKGELVFQKLTAYFYLHFFIVIYNIYCIVFISKV